MLVSEDGVRVALTQSGLRYATPFQLSEEVLRIGVDDSWSVSTRVFVFLLCALALLGSLTWGLSQHGVHSCELLPSQAFCCLCNATTDAVST